MARSNEPPKSFAEGFADGWRSVMGATAVVPPTPAFAVPAKKSAYQHGYDIGCSKTTDRPMRF